MLQLYVLKVIKSQVPYSGRKWRQCESSTPYEILSLNMVPANMKSITTIYLNCRPDLREEWLTGSEVEDAQDALVISRKLWMVLQ